MQNLDTTLSPVGSPRAPYLVQPSSPSPCSPWVVSSAGMEFISIAMLTTHNYILKSLPTAPPLPWLPRLCSCLEEIPLSPFVTNLGVKFDPHLSFDNHVTSICKTSFFHLCSISKLRPSLFLPAAEKLVHAFIFSRLDYCNALLIGIPGRSLQKLQFVLNSAARVLMRVRKHEHITPILRTLHWLPIQSRIEYKILLHTHHCLHGAAPTYLNELLISHTSTRTRSGQQHRLVTPRTRLKTMGDRAFEAASPRLWNALPDCSGPSKRNIGKSIRTDTGWMCPEEFTKEALSENYTSWRKDITYEGQPLSVLLKDVLQIHSVLCKCNICKPQPKDLDNENNDDQCCICQSDGQMLVECDHCPRSFHQNCHLPFVDDGTVRDKQKWMCTFCVFKANQEWQDSDVKETEAVLFNQISGYLMECQYLILHLFSADKEQIFATDPTLLINSYSNFIKTPMWLEKVKEKLQRNQYKTVGQFVSDVRLIFTNSASYNQSNPEFLSMGERLKQLFEEELQKVFKITE
ncbi:uncharacterized protein LOC114467841 isoform X2 [Gouania willdenowi]|uniref:uncharacterized protein LOC114467841 isoform X2 n=1 Tax=Gouania willdenowi TaxID=441366 RepID=UPI001054EF04|nr:uncharacterized protein LOC114467841 isoform X2 [Gouania willdenowi]